MKYNYLNGGAYSFYDEGTKNADVEDNVIEPGVFGAEAQIWKPASVGTWNNNTRADGRAVTKPAPVNCS